WTDSSTAERDLGRSLGESGAVVIYLGHAILNKTTTDGLRPSQNSDDMKFDIPNARLATLTAKARAKAFLVAACNSKGCFRKQSGDLAIIATDSGKKRTTISQIWAIGIKVWLE